MNCQSCGVATYVLSEVSLVLFHPLPPFAREFICVSCLNMAFQAADFAAQRGPHVVVECPLTLTKPFLVNCAQNEAHTEASSVYAQRQ